MEILFTKNKPWSLARFHHQVTVTQYGVQNGDHTYVFADDEPYEHIKKLTSEGKGKMEVKIYAEGDLVTSDHEFDYLHSHTGRTMKCNFPVNKRKKS